MKTDPESRIDMSLMALCIMSYMIPKREDLLSKIE